MFCFHTACHPLLKLGNRDVTALVLLGHPPGILALPMPAVAPTCNTELLQAQAILRCLRPARVSPWSCPVLQGFGGSGSFMSCAWALCNADPLLHLQHKSSCVPSPPTLPSFPKRERLACPFRETANLTSALLGTSLFFCLY